jgi:hypothetical protein
MTNLMVALVWSAKESTLKTPPESLHADARVVEVWSMSTPAQSRPGAL